MKDDHAARLVPKTREIIPGKAFAGGRKRYSRGADDDASNGGGSDDGGGGESEGLMSQILRIALPALVSLCMDPFMSAVDTAYIGRLGFEQGGAEVGRSSREGRGRGAGERDREVRAEGWGGMGEGLKGPYVRYEECPRVDWVPAWKQARSVSV